MRRVFDVSLLMKKDVKLLDQRIIDFQKKEVLTYSYDFPDFGKWMIKNTERFALKRITNFKVIGVI